MAVTTASAPPQTATTPATQTLDAEVALKAIPMSATDGKEPAIQMVMNECLMTLMTICTAVFGLILINYDLLDKVSQSSTSPDIIITAQKWNAVTLMHDAEFCAYMSIILAIKGRIIMYYSFLLQTKGFLYPTLISNSWKYSFA
ncbi:hypothetical protein EDD15DRAFT_2370373 [Pisolithus albus]|nr:hypothetical protein EDD15DRAFT_2370373 [Pisolithus albus]